MQVTANMLFYLVSHDDYNNPLELELNLVQSPISENHLQRGWISDSYCSLKPLWSDMGRVMPADPISPILSHCAVIILFKSVQMHQLS